MKTLLKWIRSYIGQPVWVNIGGAEFAKGRRKGDMVEYRFPDSGAVRYVSVENLKTVMPRKTIFER